MILDPIKKIINLDKLKNKTLVIIFLVLGVVSFLFKNTTAPENSNSSLIEKNQTETADTYIPEGMVLIPIEIQNKEALSHILGNFGTVDLYMPSFGDQIKSKKIATAVKIMRAPLNPDVYAVLVSEDSAPIITQHPGPFLVTIQNPKNKNTSVLRNKKNSKLQIFTGDDS